MHASLFLCALCWWSYERQVGRCCKENSTSVWWETWREGFGNISSFLLFFFIRSGSSGVVPYQRSIWLITWCELVLSVLCDDCCSICGCYIKQSKSEVSRGIHVYTLEKARCKNEWVNLYNPSVKQLSLSCSISPATSSTTQVVTCKFGSRLGQRSCFCLSNLAEEAGFVHSLRGSADWVQCKEVPVTWIQTRRRWKLFLIRLPHALQLHERELLLSLWLSSTCLLSCHVQTSCGHLLGKSG